MLMFLSYHLYDFHPDFDLQYTKLPGHLFFYFGDQVKRARTLLVNRTPDQVAYIIDSLDWMLSETKSREFEKVFNNAESEGIYFINRVNALKLLQQYYDIGAQESLPNATWTDYFAVLTLAYVAEILNEERLQAANTSLRQKGKPPREKNGFLIDTMHAIWALESMDAVGYAEQLNAEATLRVESDDGNGIIPEKVAHEKIEERGCNDGLKHTETFAKLRQKVLNLYETKYKHRSTRQAATVIYKLIQTEIDTIIHTDEPEKRIAKWILEYIRPK